MSAPVRVLDQGYVRLVESWGSDERIIEAARMSTARGFLGWGTPEKPGDEKLLRYLWDHSHATPFEMAGFVVEVRAPIMVFREWHRHRVFSVNELSARYTPLPDENYLPTVERVLHANAATTNRQAQGSGRALDAADALAWLDQLADVYEHAERVYRAGLAIGVAKELARLPVPVARYSVMRASTNLRGWLGFLRLRCDPAAQWEIREYANAVAGIVCDLYPRTYEVAAASVGLP